eukprot:COSAG04_NODE_22041_length_374_cov_1.091255_1_plen_69_part_00
MTPRQVLEFSRLLSLRPQIAFCRMLLLLRSEEVGGRKMGLPGWVRAAKRVGEPGTIVGLGKQRGIEMD